MVIYWSAYQSFSTTTEVSQGVKLNLQICIMYRKNCDSSYFVPFIQKWKDAHPQQNFNYAEIMQPKTAVDGNGLAWLQIAMQGVYNLMAKNEITYWLLFNIAPIHSKWTGGGWPFPQNEQKAIINKYKVATRMTSRNHAGTWNYNLITNDWINMNTVGWLAGWSVVGRWVGGGWYCRRVFGTGNSVICRIHKSIERGWWLMDGQMVQKHIDKRWISMVWFQYMRGVP